MPLLPGQREPIVIVDIGMRGTGKTTDVLGDPQLNINGWAQAAEAQGKKVLIVDTYDHPSYQHIQRLKLEQIPHFEKGVARIYPDIFDGNEEDEKESEVMKPFHNAVNRYMANSMIVFEDAYKQFKRQFKFPLERIVLDSKGKNNDLVFMYHKWTWVLNDLLGNADYLEIHKTKDTPHIKKQELGGCLDEVNVIYERVKAHPSKYYHETYET